MLLCPAFLSLPRLKQYLREGFLSNEAGMRNYRAIYTVPYSRWLRSEQLAFIKDGTTLVNTGRAQLVQEEALLKEL